MKILLLFFSFLTIKICNGIICFNCNPETDSNCGQRLTNLAGNITTKCSDTIESCGLFYQSSTKNFYRGCLDQFFIDGFNYTEKCSLDSIDESVFCKCDQDLCNGQLKDSFIITIDYCTEKKCVHGKAISDAEQKTCRCECEEGYTGEFCEIENFKCSAVGTFPDPKSCWIYHACFQGTFGLEKKTYTCPLKIFGEIKSQLLFQYDPNTKSGLCTFPSVFRPYVGQTCIGS